MPFAKALRCVGLILTFFALLAACRVIELDNTFPQQRYQGKWLVMFYAPWCGHCRQLEPTWTQVGNEFHNDADLSVGRLDCTKHQKVASEFHVRGYPTVLFIYGDHMVEYEGDRTKNDLIEFARKTNGPAIRVLPDKTELESAMKTQDIFFLYVHDDPAIRAPDADQQREQQQKYDREGKLEPSLFDVVEKQAKDMRKFLYFYSIFRSEIPDQFTSHADRYPALFVYKHAGVVKQFRSANSTDAARWIATQQFPLMQKLSGSVLRRVYDAGKKIVVAVLDETQNEAKVSKVSAHVKGKMLKLARKREEANENDLIFSFANGNELVNSLTYTHHATPALVVLDPWNETYYIPRSSIENMPADDVEEFLYNVTFNKAPAHGGKRFYNKIYRLGYQLCSFIYRVFSTQPIFACILFGLPLGVLTVICVVMWSADFGGGGGGDEDNRQRRRGNRRANREIVGIGGHNRPEDDDDDDDEDDEDLDDDDDDYDDDGGPQNGGNNINDDNANESEVEEIDDDALVAAEQQQQQQQVAAGGVRNEGFDAGVEDLTAEAAMRGGAVAGQ